MRYIYAPITLTNSQPQASPSNFQQLIQTPTPQYPNGVRFWSPTDGYLPAWLESISSTTNSANIWVKIPSSIPAYSIYQLFMLQDSNLSMDGGYWGEAPQLSSTYGQYDNGASIFNFYDNFAGTSLSSKWVPNGANYTVNNGLTYNSGENLVSATSFTSPYIIDYYGEGSATDDSGVFFNVQGTGANENSNLWAQRGINNGADLDYFFTYTSGSYTSYIGFQSSLDGKMNVYTLMDGTNNNPLITQINYSTTEVYTSFPSMYSSGTFGPRNTLYWQWARVRAYPPNGVMPTVSFGASFQYSGELITVTVP